MKQIRHEGSWDTAQLRGDTVVVSGIGCGCCAGGYNLTIKEAIESIDDQVKGLLAFREELNKEQP